MDIKEICAEARRATGLSQNALAERIGMDKSGLSNVLAGRRPLPAEAAIALYEITGIQPRAILEAGRKDYKSGMVARVAAMAALAVISVATGIPEAKANIDSACRNFPLSESIKH